jgi:hypothetical protein
MNIFNMLVESAMVIAVSTNAISLSLQQTMTATLYIAIITGSIVGLHLETHDNPKKKLRLGLTQTPYFPESIPPLWTPPPVYEGFALIHPVERIMVGLKGRSPFLKQGRRRQDTGPQITMLRKS